MLCVQKIINGIVSCDDDLPTPDPGSGDCHDEILMTPYNSGLVARYKFMPEYSMRNQSQEEQYIQASAAYNTKNYNEPL